MNIKKINYEHLLYVLAFIFAIIFRLFDLGAIPLSEFEADWALQAFQVAQGQAVNIGPQPAYVFLTSMLFSVFGSNDAIARILPALVGSAIIYLPFVLRHKLGRTAALIFAFALAFDPGLVSLSRLAGGPMLAFGFTMLALAYWLDGKFEIAGILGGLSLLSGPTVLIGWSGLLIAYFIYTIIMKKKLNFPAPDLRRAIVAAGVVFVLVGTYLFRFPNGISAFGSSFSTFFSGFVNASQIPFGSLILALITYQPIALLFAIAGFTYFSNPKDKKNDGIKKVNLLYFIVALFFLIIYPSRQVGDLIWAIIPLWLLASVAMAEFFKRKPVLNWTLILSQAVIVFTLFVIVWFTFINLSTLSQPPMLGDFLRAIGQGQFETISQFDMATKAYVARIGTLILIPLLTILVTVLLGLWWNHDDVWTGFGWGLLAFLLIFTAGSTWNANYSRSRQVNELWSPGSAAGYPELLLDTIENISEVNVGTRQDIDIITQVESDALAWTLRFMPNLRYAKEISYNESPSIVITSDLGGDPDLNSSYRGQSFVLSLNKSWQENVIPPNFPSWLAFRDTLAFPELVIVWARTDLFLDSANFSDEFPLVEVLPLEEQP